jgi:anti-anti-sigma regulatory factor
MYFTSKYFNDTMLFEAKDIVLSNLGIVQYKRGLATALSKQNVKNIILDFKRVKINNSEGLGTLLLAKRYSQGKGGECTLVFPQPKVVSCMKKAGIYKLFKIINNENEYQMVLKKLKKVNKEEKPLNDNTLNTK